MKKNGKKEVITMTALTPKQKKEILSKMAKNLKPVKKTEMSQVEVNEEFGLAGKMMLALLFQWLSTENRLAMTGVLKYYHPLDRAMLIYAVLLYLTTGKRLKLNCEVAQLHYDMMVEFVDEDLATVPSHRHLMRLYKKYGIYEKM